MKRLTTEQLAEKLKKDVRQMSLEEKAKLRKQLEKELEPCRRSSGSLRAHFPSKEAAEAFANDPANWPVYKGDIAHLCHKCGYWHLSRIEWLIPPAAQVMTSVN